MEQQELPEILYKYRSFQEKVIKDERYQKESFENSTLYFASQKELNDPFDLKIRKKLELLPEEDIILKLLYYIGRKERNKSFDSLWKIAEWEYKQNIVNDKDHYKNVSLLDLEEWEKTLDRRIFCLSEKNNDILMWSHYANSNQGFCLGYNRSKLDALLKKKINANYFGFSKVKYFEEYPEVKPLVGKNKDYILKRLFSKSNIWIYEQEWRFIIYNPINPIVKIDEEIVEEIILGSNVQPETEKEILKIQRDKYPHAQVFKVVPDDSEFKLNVLPYNP
ncbi:MAG: DUF2971 domain-containing protein [Prolixibacteraceae bacterium]|nr:DUF2971 domain-containing protein [Prolixibacteraceae bacterium]